MKFLVIGLGSMGKRRCRNLIANGVNPNEIYAYDTREDRVAEVSNMAMHAITVLTNDVVNDVKAFIISTPPDQHLKYIQLAIENGKDCFIEASVLSEGLEEVNQKALARKLILFPSCTMRYFKGPKLIKALIEKDTIGDVYHWQYLSGQYLPDWHPWEKVTDYYVSNALTGGCREIVPFELVWLTDIFGKIESVSSRKFKLSDLPANIDDVYFLEIDHQSAKGQLIVDVLSQSPIRSLRVIGSKGTLEWDMYREKSISIYSATNKKWSYYSTEEENKFSDYINSETPYISEIKDFLHCLQERLTPTYSLANDIDILGILACSEKSHSQDQIKVGVKVQ